MSALQSSFENYKHKHVRVINFQKYRQADDLSAKTRFTRLISFDVFEEKTNRKPYAKHFACKFNILYCFCQRDLTRC